MACSTGARYWRGSCSGTRTPAWLAAQKRYSSDKTHMRKNSLAGTSLDVSQIGFGCGRLASLSGSANSREAAATIAEACDRGINLFDTADMYGQGRAEEILGRTLG